MWGRFLSQLVGRERTEAPENEGAVSQRLSSPIPQCRLGRTEMQVSAVALGCGGPSCLGRNTGRSRRESVALVRQALDLGINLFDTSHDYKTEAFVGEALRGISRDRFFLSTKIRSRQRKTRVTPRQLRAKLEQSLRKLRTDYIDIYHLASVRPQDYSYAVTELVPTLLSLRQEGKFRFLGITERFPSDTQHQMLQQAIQDDVWDVVMVGFNFLNQTARDVIFPTTSAKDIGVLGIYALRRALSHPDRLQRLLSDLVSQQVIELEPDEIADPLSFLFDPGEVLSLPDAAYRYCCHEPGIDVVLSGTGNRQHLDANLASFLRPPLSSASRAKLHRIFKRVDCISGNETASSN